MQIELWDKTFTKRKNSTKVPTSTGVVKEVKLKSPCSLINPSFFITGVADYGYLKAWGNYYWITNVSYDINGAEYIECKIDVLASWSTVIKGATFFVERCADSRYYNVDLEDDAVSIEEGAEVTSSASTSVFDTQGAGCWLITVLGTGTTGVNVYAFSGPPPASVFCPIFDMDVSGNQPFLDAVTGIPEAVVALAKTLICDPAKYIVSLKYSPLPLSYYGGNSESVYIGWLDSGVTAVKVGSVVDHQEFILNKPTSIYSDFRKTDARCSSYYMYLPAVGHVELTPDMMDLPLKIRRSLDWLNGGVHYKLMANDDAVATYTGNIYADTGYGSASVSGGSIVQTVGGAYGMYANRPHKVVDIVDVEKTTSGIEFGSKKSAIGFVAATASAIHGIGGIMKPQASLVSPNGSRASIKADPQIIITAVQKHTAEFPTADYGRPCCKNLLIGSLEGFVQCGNASIDISATDVIRDEINTYLNTGFFVE